MDRRFALLRGINVGGRTVKGDELRAAFEAMGFADVTTFLASGNVIFGVGGAADAEDAGGAALEERIEVGLRDALGYDVATFVRSCAELARVASPERIAGSPLADDAALTLNVTFLREPPSAALRDRVLALAGPDDDFLVAGREVYWLRRGRMSESPVWAGFEKAIAGRGTARNINTVRRLIAKYCG